MTALYWYCTSRGKFHQREVTVDDEVEATLTDVLAGIDAGVRAGCFPAVPGAFQDHFGSFENCSFCDYNSLCASGRDSIDAAKRADPAVAPYSALQPDAPEDEA